jgi:LuxR family transcriptional regulator of csgAB operon
MTERSTAEVFLIGANSLLNELLGHFIGDKIGAVCTTGTTLRCIPAATDGAAQKRLVLYDFSSRNESLEDLISSDTNNILQTDYVVLTNVSEKLNIECEALQCGVRGFLYYQGGIETLLKMIRSVSNSELWISRELMTKLLLDGGLKKSIKQKGDAYTLTPQELNILNGLTKGYSNSVIAETYCLSPHTVKTHIYHIFKKIKVTNRLQAALWAAQHM